MCIDIKTTEEIVYLNHDNYFERTFINSDILKFSTCLTIYKEFIESLVDLSSSDYSLRKFSDNQFSQLKRDFQNIDKPSLSDNTFWKAELDYLLLERDGD